MQTQSTDDLEQTYRRIYRRLTLGMFLIYSAVIILGIAVLLGNPAT